MTYLQLCVQPNVLFMQSKVIILKLVDFYLKIDNDLLETSSFIVVFICFRSVGRCLDSSFWMLLLFMKVLMFSTESTSIEVSFLKFH